VYRGEREYRKRQSTEVAIEREAMQREAMYRGEREVRGSRVRGDVQR